MCNFIHPSYENNLDFLEYYSNLTWNILELPLHCVFFFLQMAEEISKPLSAAQKVTMVSSGGSEVGAAKLAGEVLEIMTRLPTAVEKLTGVDISQVRVCV